MIPIGKPAIHFGANEKHRQRYRFIISSLFVALLAIVLLSRMTYLQLLQFDHYRNLSEDNRIRVEPIAPYRGRIFDRHGVLLADARLTYSLEIVPEAVADMDALLDRLATLVAISVEDRQRFQTLKRRKSDFEPTPIRNRLSEREVALFMVNRPLFSGVNVYTRWTRHYPHGTLAAHLLGYVSRISDHELKQINIRDYHGIQHIGKTGVERAAERKLHGRAGYQQVEINAEGRTIRVLEKTLGTPGDDLYLTLDANVQRVAEQAFTDDRGAVVAIEPATGAILAFASMPAYDPNLFTDGISTRDFAKLRDANARPLFNRVLQGQYPPGSTIKPFIALAGLETTTVAPDQHYQCRGWFQLPNSTRRYRDWKKYGHGSVNLNAAIAQSCDVYFYELAQQLKIKRIHHQLQRFGFGQRNRIDLFGEASGLLPSPAWKQRVHQQPWFPGETLITGIGQGFMLATPLQLVTATAAIAMRGQHLKPQIILRRQATGGGSAQTMTPQPLSVIKLKNPQYWDTIIASMSEVVHGTKGTARRIAAGARYRIAGKTGTSQVFSLAQDETYDAEKLPKHLRDHALFIAFAPLAEPRIAVAVIVENGGSGSSAAAPIARRVMDAWLVRNAASFERTAPPPQPAQ